MLDVLGISRLACEMRSIIHFYNVAKFTKQTAQGGVIFLYITQMNFTRILLQLLIYAKLCTLHCNKIVTLHPNCYQTFLSNNPSSFRHFAMKTRAVFLYNT